MSTAAQVKYIEEVVLDNSDNVILATLTDWLSRARFERQGPEWEKCIDELFSEKKDLIKTIKLVQKV